MPKINELWLKQIISEIHKANVDTSQTKMYQILKAAMCILSQGGSKNNLEIYEILCTNQSFYRSIFDSKEPLRLDEI